MHKVKNEIKSYDTYNKLNKNPNADTNLNYDIIFNDRTSICQLSW
jgi:hypothetical protein